MPFRFGVSGFPTIKYFPKEDKSGINFEGDRSLTGLLDFVNEKAGTFRTAAGKLNRDVNPLILILTLHPFNSTILIHSPNLQAGKIAELEDLAKELVKSSDKASVFEKLKAAADKVGTK